MPSSRTAARRLLTLLTVSIAQAGDATDYSVTLEGNCQYQVVMGWDDWADNAVYTLFKNGKYQFQFGDGHKNSYAFFWSKALTSTRASSIQISIRWRRQSTATKSSMPRKWADVIRRSPQQETNSSISAAPVPIRRTSCSSSDQQYYRRPADANAIG
jgi:hypothetical protein